MASPGGFGVGIERLCLPSGLVIGSARLGGPTQIVFDFIREIRLDRHRTIVEKAYDSIDYNFI